MWAFLKSLFLSKSGGRSRNVYDVKDTRPLEPFPMPRKSNLNEAQQKWAENIKAALSNIKVDKHTTFIHCSATDHKAHDDVEVIRRWHVQDNGWSDVAYHFFIQKSGHVQVGRDINRHPASHAPYNTDTISICLSGNTAFTKEQEDSLCLLCCFLDEWSFINNNQRMVFRGHKEVAARDCPVIDYHHILNLSDTGEARHPISTFITS